MAAPIITPAGPLEVYAPGNKLLEADQPVFWTTAYGQLSPFGFQVLGEGVLGFDDALFGREIVLTVPNVTRPTAFAVRATNEAGEWTEVLITVVSSFPMTPHYPYPFKIGMVGVVMGESRNGKTTGRIVEGGGVQESFSLVFKNKRRAEADGVITHWENHYPPDETQHYFFYSDRYIIRASGLFVYDSEIEGATSSHNAGEMSIVIKRKMS